MTAIKRDLFLDNKGKRILFVLMVFFLTNLLSYLIDPYSNYWQVYFKRDFLKILEDIFVTLVCGLIISESSIYISYQLNRTIPWTEKPVKRLILETALHITMVLLINLLVVAFYVVIANNSGNSIIGPAMSIEETKGMIHWIVVSIAIAFMIMGVNTGNYLILNWKNAALRAAELNQVAMEAELQSLKLQIDPHFVFNNLSTLSELILKDQQLGYEYAENFSRIYRYMLVSSKKDIIHLEDELNFLDSYIFLIKNRMGEGVRFEINVDKDNLNFLLPPMTLQLLVENALKHNKTSRKEPLTVQICNNEKSELVVKNKLLPIETSIVSSKIGIANIKRRYGLLSERQPKITNDGKYFTVTLPLLKV